MRDRRFAGRDAWLAAVELALAHTAAGPILAAKGLDHDTVCRVARVEATCASGLGISSMSPEQLAGATGLARRVVRKARLALVELGLQDVVASQGGGGGTQRELHHE